MGWLRHAALVSVASRASSCSETALSRNLGPASTGLLMDMGPSVVLDTGRVEIVVISRHQEPNDLACLLSIPLIITICGVGLFDTWFNFRARASSKKP